MQTSVFDNYEVFDFFRGKWVSFCSNKVPSSTKNTFWIWRCGWNCQHPFSLVGQQRKNTLTSLPPLQYIIIPSRVPSRARARARTFIWFRASSSSSSSIYMVLSKLKLKLKLCLNFRASSSSSSSFFCAFEQAQAQAFCVLSRKLELELETFFVLATP